LVKYPYYATEQKIFDTLDLVQQFTTGTVPVEMAKNNDCENTNRKCPKTVMKLKWTNLRSDTTYSIHLDLITSSLVPFFCRRTIIPARIPRTIPLGLKPSKLRPISP
jgi:hypothetical protein